jgi:GPI mannosyltransferase 3
VPVVLFTFAPFLLICLYQSKDRIVRVLSGLFLFKIGILSCISHKEFRFLMPLLPLAFACIGLNLYQLQAATATLTLYRGKHLFNGVILLLVITHSIPGLYLAIVHQRGVIDVMHWLRNEARHKSHPVENVLFLMPCHSTPFYSHFHHNISMRFLTCEPPIM